MGFLFVCLCVFSFLFFLAFSWVLSIRRGKKFDDAFSVQTGPSAYSITVGMWSWSGKMLHTWTFMRMNEGVQPYFSRPIFMNLHAINTDDLWFYFFMFYFSSCIQLCFTIHANIGSWHSNLFISFPKVSLLCECTLCFIIRVQESKKSNKYTCIY